MKHEKQIIFDHNVIDFVTVAVEFCKVLERDDEYTRTTFVDTTVKLLPLLYLKALLLPHCENTGEERTDSFVTESIYEHIRSGITRIMSDKDDYLDVFVADMKYSDQPIIRYISEDLSDIYQDVRNFVEAFSTGMEDIINDALAICKENFSEYWGQKLVNTLRALHEVKFSLSDDEYIE